MLLLVPALAGCFGSPITSSDSKVPLHSIEIVPYVTVAYMKYHNYWGNGECDTYHWIDVRNIGRSNENDLKCYLTNFPPEWKLEQLSKACDKGKVEYDYLTTSVKTLYAQHDETNDAWHTEYDTTIRLRIRVNCGQLGGWDLDGDGITDTTNYNENGIEVGTFARDEPYDFYFHISNDYCQSSIKLQVYVVDDPGFELTKNYQYPYGPV